MTPSVDTSVSVVLPAFNAAATIAQSIASARAQQWDGLDIVVVDDGSTDATRDVVTRLAGDDLRLVEQTNAGPAAARNAGIAHARGAWVAFLDADDAWLAGKLESQFALVRRRPEVGLVWGGATIVEPSGSTVPWPAFAPREHPFLALLSGNHIAAPTVLARRDLLGRAGAFDERLRTGEDWDLWLRLAAIAPADGVSHSVCLVRRSNVAAKYRLDDFDTAWPIVLEKAFENPAAQAAFPGLAARRPEITSWHYAVLAKSHLHMGDRAGYARWAGRCVRASAAGARFLLPGARRPGAREVQ